MVGNGSPDRFRGLVSNGRLGNEADRRQRDLQRAVRQPATYTPETPSRRKKGERTPKPVIWTPYDGKPNTWIDNPTE